MVDKSICPKCRKLFKQENVAQLGPFCSKRCQNAELHNWLTEKYVISRELQESDDLGEQAHVLAEEQEF